MGTIVSIERPDDGVKLYCHQCKEPGKLYPGPLIKCSCGWKFLKSRTKHPWDKRWGHIYIGQIQYKDKYV